METTASNDASANGSADTLPRTSRVPRVRARRTASGEISIPTFQPSDRRFARRPPVPLPASRIRGGPVLSPRSRSSQASISRRTPTYHQWRSSTANIASYSWGFTGEPSGDPVPVHESRGGAEQQETRRDPPREPEAGAAPRSLGERVIGRVDDHQE